MCVLLYRFGAVQHVVRDGSLCIEFTIYSGYPNATATDIIDDIKDDPPPGFIFDTKRPDDLDVCEDEVNGCNGGSSDNTLLFIIIGVACFLFFLLLAVVWYFLHKRVKRQFTAVAEGDAGAAAAAVTVHVEVDNTKRESTAWKEEE
jgi:Na+-transporting methylmalonyl-CoA/oxaloacetate decarboxylase gamma subunit